MVVEGFQQARLTVSAQYVGRIRPLRYGETSWVGSIGSEPPVRAMGGRPASRVAVGGDDDPGRVAAEERSQLARLLVGERGAERGDADVSPVGRMRDGDGVEGSFDEDGCRAVVKVVGSFGEPVEEVALGEGGGRLGVEVFGAGVLVFVAGGVTTGDEPHEVVAAVDGEYEAIAEAVDDPTAIGTAGKAGVDECIEGGAAIGEAAHQAGGTGWCVPDGEAGVVEQVGAEAVP